MPDQDTGADLVQEVIADNPVEEKGVRDEWKKQVGWHRKEDIHLLRGRRRSTASGGTDYHRQPEQHSRGRGQQRRTHRQREARSSPAPDGRELEIQEPPNEHAPNPRSVSKNYHNKAHAINKEIRNDVLLAIAALLLLVGGAMALLRRMRQSETKKQRSR
jgi:hypothetical protein